MSASLALQDAINTKLRRTYTEPEIADVLSALSAMPLADRLALARALVPGWAVVPREATEGMIAALRGTTLCSDGTHVHIYRAMLTAAEKETNDERA